MQNMQAICRLSSYFSILHAICKICKIYARYAKYANVISNMQNMHCPLCWWMRVIVSGPPSSSFPFCLRAFQPESMQMSRHSSSTLTSHHLEPCQTRYRDMISRYRYIPILHPISGTILQIPDIGYFPISDIPISGNTRYRDSRYRECHDIGNPDIGTNIGIYRYRDQHFPISCLS